MSAVDNWNEFVSGTDVNDELDQDTVCETIELAVDALAELEVERDEAMATMYHERGDKEQAEAELAALRAQHHYPHTCRDGHPEIGHSTDNERCPVCLMRDERDARYPS